MQHTGIRICGALIRFLGYDRDSRSGAADLVRVCSGFKILQHNSEYDMMYGVSNSIKRTEK